MLVSVIGFDDGVDSVVGFDGGVELVGGFMVGHYDGSR